MQQRRGQQQQQQKQQKQRHQHAQQQQQMQQHASYDLTLLLFIELDFVLQSLQHRDEAFCPFAWGLA